MVQIYLTFIAYLIVQILCIACIHYAKDSVLWSFLLLIIAMILFQIVQNYNTTRIPSYVFVPVVVIGPICFTQLDSIVIKS
jgi:hypothetical protein